MKKKIVVLLKDSWKTFRRTYFSEVTSQAAQAPAVRWSPCEIRVSEIIRVCMGIFTAALRNKKLSQILNTNISPYFQSALLAIWPLTMLKEPILASYLFLGLLIKEAQGCTLHYRTPDSRSETPTSRLLGVQKQSPFTLRSFNISPASFYFGHY